MTLVLSLKESVIAATDFYGVFNGERPDLIRTGIKVVDDEIGGLGPGSCGILGAGTSVGKSSLMLAANLASEDHTAILSVEDPADVLGGRLIGHLAGVNPKRLRMGDIGEDDQERIDQLIARLEDRDDVHIAYAVGGKREDIELAMERLAEKGVRMVWLDYVQKVKNGGNDRRAEVGAVFTEFQSLCARYNMAGMVISQVSRLADDTKRPTMKNLKESGDLENEARLVIMIWQDAKWGQIVNGVIEKSTYGGQGREFAYRRNHNGVLEPIERGDW